MVHQFHKGRQGEGQHVSKAGKHKEREGDGPRRSAQGETGSEGFRKMNTSRTVQDHWDKLSWATDNVLHTGLSRKEAGSFTVRSQGLWGTDLDSQSPPSELCCP